LCFGLNAVGTQIWRLISEGCSSEQTVATLLEGYEIVEARVQKDLDILLEQLNDVGLITLHTERLTSAR